MKIINIQPQLTAKYSNVTNYQTKPQQAQISPQYARELPSTQQYLAFTGGASLNLAQTVKRLDILAGKNSSIYPPNIREWLGLILEEGNKAKETLIDVHKKYFSSLKKDFITLDEIKAKFPEFDTVVPANSIKPQEGSFIDKFQKGELEYFDNNEDLSVQLIKLYWGDGFSLTDLKRYTGGIDLYHTMKNALHIPTASRDYGHYLKFSDPKYNERLTQEMTLKRLEAMDRKAQLENGDPVFIPSRSRGALSEEHKRRISEGQIRYWQENPEKIYEMSERQKEFYRENPERCEDFKRVLDRAWNIFGADNIKKAMSNFFKKAQVPMFDLETPNNMTTTQTKTLGVFWGQNEWARKSFSKNMKHAWKKIKEENEKIYTIQTVPTKLMEKVEKLAGVEKGSLHFETKFNPFTNISSIDEEANALYKRITDQIPGLPDIMADTYQLGSLILVKKIENMDLRKLPKNYTELVLYAKAITRNNIAKDGLYAIRTTKETQQDFLQLAYMIAKLGCGKAKPFITQALDEAFETSIAFHKAQDVLK